MASVDDRIVAMKFDNAAFEQRIASTMASLEKLKGSLDFANAKKGMEDLQKVGKSFNLEGIASALDGISGKFSAMGAVAFTVLQNITNRAVDAGIQIAKSLSLDQVITGFHEYETNMNSIQTILSNTKADATTLDDVNKALDTLNEYSDQTIYNFSQMARNIGTFTAAGVDLDTSVMGIKGIANLAAISGSNAEQASTAMYQLSQALATGSVKLMDWNSVVNAGMGGEVFQKALFETGKSLGTIKDVPMKQTFEQWKEAGNSFRGSLETGWITAEVLTNTLSGFTGDLTEAQILSMGYTQEQAAEILELGKTGKAAATEVKTLTQLIGTVKESIASGWSASFRIVFGTFEEAKTLFTGISDTLGKMVSESADSRNKLLQGWKDLGGRDVLIKALQSGFEGLLAIIKPIKAAFRDIFPKKTAMDLFVLTLKFKDFMDALTPSPAVVVLITRAFRGVFAAFSIGIEIVKGIAGVFGDLFHMFAGEDPNKGILGFAARIGDGIVKLKETLVDGGGIAAFFENMSGAISSFISGLSFDNVLTRIREVLGKIKDAIFGIFDGSDGSDGGIKMTGRISDAFERLGDRFGWVIDLAKKVASVFSWVFDKVAAVWGWVWGKISAVWDLLSSFAGFIREKFADLPQKIAEVMSKGDYNQVLDTINTGLFAGLVLMFKKFLDNGPGNWFKGITSSINGLTGSLSGTLNQINGSFGALTGTLTAMQTNLKADALLKIAKAVGLLTISIVVLSLIDSMALTKSMTAIAIGFGQLVTAMALIDKISSGPGGAAKIGLIAGGLILLAGAMVLLSLAVKIMSTMSWEELAKGLLGVTILLGVLSLVIKPMTDNSGKMVSTGLGLIAVAIALNILALAVKSFAEMEWEAMAQGLVGVGAGLLIIAGAMQLMPSGMVTKGVGLLAIAVALNIMALAVKSFADMKWKDLGKGMAGMAAALLIIAGATQLMPNGVSLALQGAGLLAIGIGLVAISMAIKILGAMSWEDMAKGLAGIGATLGLLAAAMHLMQGAIGGAIAIAIVAPALLLLAKALKKFAGMSWGELVKGLTGLAATLGVLALGAIALGGAIPVLLGLGVALILLGAGFALFGIGANAVAVAFSIIATAGTQGVATLLSALEGLIGLLPSLIAAFSDGLLQLAQKVLEALPSMIASLDEILVAFLDLIINNIPKLGETFKTFILEALAILKEVFPELVKTGVEMIKEFLKGITQAFPDVVATGFALLMELLRGIRDNIAEITTTVAEIIIEFLNALAAKASEIVAAGLAVLVAFLKGIADNIDDVVAAAVDVLTSFLTSIADGADDILAAGADIIVKIIEGIGSALTKITTAAADTVVAFLQGLDDNILKIVDAGWEFIINLINGISDSIDENMPKLREAGIKMAGSIIDGMTFGLAGKIGGVIKGAGNLAGSVLDEITGENGFDTGSPSKVMTYIGEMIVLGLAKGIDNNNTALNSANAFGEKITSSFQKSLSGIPAVLNGLEEFNPTITPILDLTNVEKSASQLGNILGSGGLLTAQLSYNQAVGLSMSSTASDASSTDKGVSAPVAVKFEQNNYSPEALSTSDIYRQTRNQITMAKEELAVL